ncbi:MAG: bacteriohopanetetrol glucosamine biosynthesis glycosyltransferase HpnI [Candidatus Rokubacteria bacterium]|nr:bacteriohopanetetrol glucosamine biosynthesis glycosyltransferase HpnI [Candidatus Rokubacteria bacterium]
MNVLSATAVAAVLVSTAYWLYALGCIARFRRRSEAPVAGAPPVTILKPLCGAHPGLYDALRSFCAQDYSDFQLVFGVQDAADPAVEVVQRLMDEFRDRNLKLVVNERNASVNPKVANLINLYESAEHDVLVVADADIRVEPDYLRSVVAPLMRPDVDLVTCLYRAGDEGRGWGTLARLFIDDWFFPSALVSATGARLRHAFGATLVFRRSTLDAVGGLASVGAYLADDYVLGERIAARGGTVVLSRYVVETRVVASGFAALFFHELRWSRTMRAVRPVGYFLAAITYGFGWAALALVASGFAWPAVAATALHGAARAAVHRAARRALGGRSRARLAWLLPARDALSIVLWAAAFTGRTVWWGRRRFSIDLSGRLERR